MARGVAKVDPSTPRGAHQRPLQLPKKLRQGDKASPDGNNPKKRRLAWMAKSLMAAGVDVKFPDEE